MPRQKPTTIGLNDEQKIAIAKAAIEHVLLQIATNGRVSYFLGHGTQSYRLLTTALASIDNIEAEHARAAFEPATGENPREVRVTTGGGALYAATHRHGPAWETLADYEREQWSDNERDLLTDYYGLERRIGEENEG